jgi:hypothetical protein
MSSGLLDACIPAVFSTSAPVSLRLFLTLKCSNNDLFYEKKLVTPETKHFILGCILKGLSHEIFEPVYWPVWIPLSLNKNRFWFLNFKEAPLV